MGLKQKSFLYKEIKKHINKPMKKTKNNEAKTIKNLKKKLKQEDLILCKADKGNTITILNKEDYIQKTKKLISESGLDEI